MARKKRSVKKDSNEKKCITPTFRVAFPAVFTARTSEDEDGNTTQGKFSLTMIFKEGEDLGKMERLVNNIIKEKFPGKKPRNIRTPFRDGEEKEEYDGFESGMVFCTASSFRRPGIIDEDREPILDSEEFYAGCYARATISAYYYDKKGNKGVAFGLRNLQKLKDADRLDGVVAAEDDFDDDEDEADW